MEHYVMLGRARSWYAEQGAGDPLVLLHPGLVDARAFGPNLAAWSERFHTFTPERRGHGHTQDVEGPLTFEQMARTPSPPSAAATASDAMPWSPDIRMLT